MAPAAKSSLPERIDDTTVAPYLTHIITHHGKVTLVPPQNQGRLRTNKRTRKVRTSQIEHTNPSTSSLSLSSLGSASGQPKKTRKLKRSVAQNAPDNVDTVPLGVAVSESRVPTSRLPPPPSYDSLRSETALSTSSDVVSFALSSSSSDDFEDITQVDFESQWELDRMAGFTLEERVRREWHRRQASMNRTTRSANVESSFSNALHRLPSRHDEILSDFSTSASTPPPLPFKDIHKAPETVHFSTLSSRPSPLESGLTVSPGRSSSCSPVASFKNTSQHVDAKSSLEDWDILESVGMNATHSSHSPYSFAPMSTNHKPSATPRIPSQNPGLSRASSPVSDGVEPSYPVQCGSPRNAEQAANPTNAIDTRSCANSPCAEFKETNFSPRTSRKGKEREIQSACDTAWKHSAIHSRPLPTPPNSLEASHSSHSAASSSTKASLSFLPQLESFVNNAADLQVTSSHSEPSPATILPSKDFTSPVRDRIVPMRDRPVPLPPAEFLLRSRTKRKPPPPPPSSYRHSVSGLLNRDVTCIDQSLDCVTKNALQDEIVAQPAAAPHRGHRTPDTLPLSRPGSRDIPSLPFTSSKSESGRTALVKDTISLASNQNGSSSEAGSLGPAHHPSTTTEYSNGSGDLRNASAQVEPAIDEVFIRPPEQSPVLGIMEEDSHHATSVDPSVNNSLSPEISSSAPPTSVVPPQEALGPYTDLDILLSRLDDASSGNRYEDLLTVSELLGPAQPQPTPSQSLGDLPLGRIEVLRRRKLQDGRVKLKLSLFGVMVDRCGICLSQFKDAEWAVLLPCVHPFHTNCLQSWLARNRTCPLCRIALDIS